jgi:aerobic-type carbon monoxide dehydrogenase small subunit (CoxS/CutS family)
MREVAVAIDVNGQRRQATVEPRLTLADFIRERCALTGPTSAASTACAARARSSSTAPQSEPA